MTYQKSFIFLLLVSEKSFASLYLLPLVTIEPPSGLERLQHQHGHAERLMYTHIFWVHTF